MNIDKRYAEEFGTEKVQQPGGVLKLLAVFIVTSMLSLDGLLVAIPLLLILSLGGYLTVWLPGFAWICLMLAVGCLVLTALILVVIAASFGDADNDGYPES